VLSKTGTVVPGLTRTVRLTAHMAMRLVHRQHRTHGEGGLLTLMLAADLITAALAQPCSPLHRHLAVLAYNQALDWCVAAHVYDGPRIG